MMSGPRASRRAAYLGAFFRSMGTFKKLVMAALLAALLLLSGYLLGRRADRAPDSAVIVRTDTLRIRDTVLIERPVPVEVRVTDTMLVAETDTVTVNDTVYLSLSRETRVYGDSTYRAQVSGFRPSIDWIEVYPQTVYVTKNVITEDVRRWGIGLQAGYGAYAAGGQVRLAPYLGVGISYDILRW